MLFEGLKPAAGVQGAVEIGPLEFLKEIGMISGHHRQFGTLQDSKPILGFPRKGQTAYTMLGLFAQ
jgi:hypothetical protein